MFYQPGLSAHIFYSRLVQHNTRRIGEKFDRKIAPVLKLPPQCFPIFSVVIWFSTVLLEIPNLVAILLVRNYMARWYAQGLAALFLM